MIGAYQSIIGPLSQETYLFCQLQGFNCITDEWTVFMGYYHSIEVEPLLVELLIRTAISTICINSVQGFIRNSSGLKDLDVPQIRDIRYRDFSLQLIIKICRYHTVSNSTRTVLVLVLVSVITCTYVPYSYIFIELQGGWWISLDNASSAT